MKAQVSISGSGVDAPTAAGTQDVAAPTARPSRPGMLCITIVSIDWCPWIDAQGSVWGDFRKDIAVPTGAAMDMRELTEKMKARSFDFGE